MGKKRLAFHEITLENDIKYRGPLSYRHLRMFGWLFLILSQISVILKLAQRVNSELNFGVITNIISTLSSLTVPLFLIANFSLILNSQKSYKPLLIKYAIYMVGTTILFMYFYEHIVGGLFRAYIGTEDLNFAMAGALLNRSGFIAFNVFLDLFLCSLFMFFLDYTPNRFFTGKKIVVFRLFALLPVAYELVSIIVKLKAANRSIILAPYLYPLLTTKPPLCFMAFILLGLYMFRTKRKYLKKGKTIEQYHEYLMTNSNSLRLSIRMAIIFVVMAVLDFIILMGIVVGTYMHHVEMSNADLVSSSVNIAMASGFGDSVVLIIMAPIVLLFSYNRKIEEGLVDNLMPILGVIGCILVYVEGLYRILLLTAGMYSDYIALIKGFFMRV